MMDDYKVSDNSYGVEDRKTISPHHSYPTNGVRPSDFNFKKEWEKTAVKVYGYEGVNVIGIDF